MDERVHKITPYLFAPPTVGRQAPAPQASTPSVDGLLVAVRGGRVRLDPPNAVYLIFRIHDDPAPLRSAIGKQLSIGLWDYQRSMRVIAELISVRDGRQLQEPTQTSYLVFRVYEDLRLLGVYVGKKVPLDF